MIDNKNYSDSKKSLKESLLAQSDSKKRYDLPNGLEDEAETRHEEGAVNILGALGENIARRILFFSTFEDMEFQMNLCKIENLFGEGNEVMN